MEWAVKLDGEDTWVSMTEMKRGDTHELSLSEEGEVIVKFRVGKKGPNYGHFLGNLIQRVFPQKGPNSHAALLYASFVRGDDSGREWPDWDDLTPSTRARWEEAAADGQSEKDSA